MNYWEKKIGLITGGSSGLGFQIARTFAQKGGLPILVARDWERLRQAQESLADEQLKTDCIQADLTDADQAAAAIQETISRHGTVDLLVNNVGKSIRSALADTSPQAYTDLLQTNLMTAIHCTLPALPFIKESSGHIVNIGSLASRFAWPLVAPYTTSKFALAGFSQQLRMELPRNVHVLLVCPGPLKEEAGVDRYADQTASLPEAAKKPGAGVRLNGICPSRLAVRILKSCQKRKPELMMPGRARLLFSISAMLPSLGDWIIRRFQSK